jgi:hypothetical protein
MTLTRWIPTFLAFPIGGLAAIELIGSSDGPLAAAAGGLLAGAILGAAQWLALRASGTSSRWIGRTAAAMAAGAAVSAAVTGSGAEVADLVLSGLITGAAVGAAQGPLLERGGRTAIAWAGVTAGAWSLGWLITSQVIVDAERGFHVFGSTGALAATLLTGLALRALGGRPAPAVAGA